jgi:hypothetical protein
VQLQYAGETAVLLTKTAPLARYCGTYVCLPLSIVGCAVPCFVVQGMVTHVTDVKPLAAVLTYLDQDSNTEVYQEVRRCQCVLGTFCVETVREQLKKQSGCCVIACWVQSSGLHRVVTETIDQLPHTWQAALHMHRNKDPV